MAGRHPGPVARAGRDVHARAQAQMDRQPGENEAVVAQPYRSLRGRSVDFVPESRRNHLPKMTPYWLTNHFSVWFGLFRVRASVGPGPMGPS